MNSCLKIVRIVIKNNKMFKFINFSLKFLIIFFGILIFFVFSNQTYAENFIDLGPSLKLSYKTGNIDTNTFNGFASDISFFDKFNNDELIGNAKTLKIESQKNKHGQVIINLFSLSEIFAYDDEFGFEIVIDKISIRDFNSAILKDDFAEDVANYDLLNAQLLLIVFH